MYKTQKYQCKKIKKFIAFDARFVSQTERNYQIIDPIISQQGLSKTVLELRGMPKHKKKDIET